MKTQIVLKEFKTALIVCLGMGLLYFVRGSYLPYFFPVYQDLTPLNYDQISLLLIFFFAVQTVIPPFIGGLHTSKHRAKILSFGSILILLFGFAILLLKPSFLGALLSVLLIGSAIISLKNILYTLMLEGVKGHYLRKMAAIRTTVMNVGSFLGNISTLGLLAFLGTRLHIFFIIFILCVFGGLIFLNFTKKDKTDVTFVQKKKIDFIGPWKNKSFIAETILLFAIIIPDGCWGTIIPKYLIDLYQSNQLLAFIYGISLTTILLFSYPLNSWLSKKLSENSFQLSRLKWLALILFLTGLSLFSFSYNKIILGFAVLLVILAEIIIIPCYDETVKKHAGEPSQIGSYYGVLNLFDGSARIIGATISLTLYGFIKETELLGSFWILVVGIFSVILLFASLISHLLHRQIL